MPKPKRAWTDQRVEIILGRLLRGGVFLAAAIVLIGGVLYLVRHGAAFPDYRDFRGEPTDLRTVRGIVADGLTWSSRGLIQLGLLLLVVTPVARVAFSVFAFIRLRDRMYVNVTLIVLILLLYSLSGGQL
jgi:uncharacterized membrane protein